MDEFNNLFDTSRFLKVMADLETGKDEPEPHQFKRTAIVSGIDLNDPAIRAQLHGPGPFHLVANQVTDAALFKAKAIAICEQWEKICKDIPDRYAVASSIKLKIMEINP